MTTAADCTAENYANALLRDAGAGAVASCARAHPALRAARCGLTALTGNSRGSAQTCPAPLAACADGVIAALAAIAENSPLRSLDGAALLGERAACFGYTRKGAISAGGSCRLLPAADGWLAINLARASDWELIPALLESGIARDWSEFALALLNSRFSVDALIERGRLLGLGISAMTPPPAADTAWAQRRAFAKNPARKKSSPPLVVDLSSLWAGPLCGNLLQLLGARVIKIESVQRPDGARFGAQNFFDVLNANKECIALDLHTPRGREQLRQLLLRADIVIEASRPRALRQMNIAVEDIFAHNPALTWISITGYGRDEPRANWIAFGDDAGVAAGLSQMLFDVTGEAMFCGDAIADPLTGMHAAFAAWTSYWRGGGELIALALRDVVAHCARFGGASDTNAARARHRDWMNVLGKSAEPIAAPRARALTAHARALGADTQTALAEFDIRC